MSVRTYESFTFLKWTRDLKESHHEASMGDCQVCRQSCDQMTRRDQAGWEGKGPMEEVSVAFEVLSQNPGEFSLYKQALGPELGCLSLR